MDKVEFQGNVKQIDQAHKEINRLMDDAELELNILIRNQDLIKETFQAELNKAKVAKQNIEDYFNISTDERKNLRKEVLNQETSKFNSAMKRLISALHQNLNMQAQLLADLGEC